MEKHIDEDKVERLTLPTASFSIRQTHIRWITQAAKSAGISKSELIRRILDRAMTEGDRAA